MKGEGDRGEDPEREDEHDEGEQCHRSLVDSRHTVPENHPEIITATSNVHIIM